MLTNIRHRVRKVRLKDKFKLKTCLYCYKKFHTDRKNKKFCHSNCRSSYNNYKDKM